MLICVEIDKIFLLSGAPLFPTGEQVKFASLETGFWNSYLSGALKDRWYGQKKFVIPIGVLILMCILAIVLGSALGIRMSETVLGKIYFLSPKHSLILSIHTIVFDS